MALCGSSLEGDTLSRSLTRMLNKNVNNNKRVSRIVRIPIKVQYRLLAERLYGLPYNLRWWESPTLLLQQYHTNAIVSRGFVRYVRVLGE